MTEVEQAITEIDAIDELPFGKVGKALDRIRELLVKIHRKSEAAEADDGT